MNKLDNIADKTLEKKDFQDNNMCIPNSDLKRVVVIGGGFAGLALVKSLKNKPLQVVLLDKNNHHQFQPLLYQVATSGLEPDSIVFPYRKQISGYKNTFFRLATVDNIITESKTVQTDKGNIHYDYLVIATGTISNFFGLKNIQKNSIGLKNIIDSLNIRHLMLQNLEQATISCDTKEREALTNFVIVGGGPAGIEMAGALAEFKKYIIPKDYPEFNPSEMQIHLIEGSNRLISAMSVKASKNALKYLEKLEVKVFLNEIVSDYKNNVVLTKRGKQFLSKNLIWTAGVTGNLPKGIEDKHLIYGNRLQTNKFLQVIGLNNVFALGDIAGIVSDKYPKGHPQLAQPAIQQGKILAKNLLNIINNKDLIAFKYNDKGSLATVGKRRAVADLGKFHLGGYVAWLLWSVVHLMAISGFKNKLFVGLNWIISYFTYDKSNRLIIRNYKKK